MHLRKFKKNYLAFRCCIDNIKEKKEAPTFTSS